MDLREHPHATGARREPGRSGGPQPARNGADSHEAKLRPFCTMRVLRRANPQRQSCADRSSRADSGAATAQNGALCNMAAARSCASANAENSRLPSDNAALARLSWPTCTRTQWACAHARQGCRACWIAAHRRTKPARDGRGSRRVTCRARRRGSVRPRKASACTARDGVWCDQAPWCASASRSGVVGSCSRSGSGDTASRSCPCASFAAGCVAACTALSFAIETWV